MSHPPPDHAAWAQGSRETLRVLVVGPLHGAAAAAVEALRSAGLAFEVRVVGAEEASEAVEAFRPQLILPGNGVPAAGELNGGLVFRSIVEHSSNLFYVHGTDHVLTYVSPRCRDILGLEPEEALVKWTTLVTDHPANRAGFEAAQRAIETGVEQPPYELELRGRGGQPVWVEVHESPVVRHGRTVAIVGALHDITARKRAEAHIALLGNALRAIAEGVCVTDLDDRIVFVNPAFCEIYGYTEGELVGQPIELLRVSDNPPGIGDEIVAGTLAGGWRGELWNRRKDGTRLLVALNTAPVRDDRGEVVALIGVIRDVTEERRAAVGEQRRLLQLAAVNRISRHVTSLMPVHELLQAAVREIQAQFGYHNVVILQLDRARNELGQQAMAGGFAHLARPDYRQKVGEGIIGCAAREGVTVYAPDVLRDPRYLRGFPEAVATRSEIAVPLKIGDEVLGVLDVQETRPHAFDDTDVQTLETLAGQLAAVLDSARLFDRLQGELEERQRAEAALSQAVAELEQARAELERRVAERTAELAAANRKLAAEVAERRAAEEGIRASEERFRALAEHSADVIMRFDRHGRHLFVNQAVEPQTGIPVAQFLGRTHRELGFPEHLCALWEDAIGRVFATGQVQRVEFQLPNGIWIDWMLMPELGPDGEVVAVITDARDITQRKELEAELERRVAERTAELAAANAALKASEEKYRRFFEEDLTADFISTPDGQLLAANPAFVKLFGFASLEEALATNTTELYPNAAERRALLEELRQTGRITLREVERRRRDGSTVHLIENVSAVFSPTGELQALWGYLFDITERKRLEEQLRQAQKMEAIGRLAGGVAHDFNNLLQAVLSLAQVLQAKAQQPELHDIAAELLTHARRGAELTRQLLLFARREVSQRLPLDLNEAVREGLGLLRRVIPESIRVAVELAREVLPVLGDRGQLQQVLTNLVLNARDAMPEGGVLTVATGRLAEEVWLEVRDTGVGMEPAVQERIFEPFFSTKGREEGTGLGLAVVHGIVERHGGRIEVDSSSGYGSRFRVVLPAAQELGAGGAATAGEAMDLAPGNGERVLVVEDEDGAREGLRQLLELLGYQVVALASGEEARALPVESPFEVLLTDYLLPGIDGVLLSHELVARWPALRVILMSGYAENDLVREAVAAGRLRYLAKPFDVATLAREIRKALREPAP